MTNKHRELTDREGGVCIHGNNGKDVRPNALQPQQRKKGKEARLESRKSDKEVTLKGGKGFRVDARLARELVDEFRCLLERHPAKYATLRDLVEGRPPEDASPAILKGLELSGLVTKTGALRPYVREVFLASFDIDSTTFADPFEPANQAEELILHRCEVGAVKRLNSFARRIGLDQEGSERG